MRRGWCTIVSVSASKQMIVSFSKLIPKAEELVNNEESLDQYHSALRRTCQLRIAGAKYVITQAAAVEPTLFDQDITSAGLKASPSPNKPKASEEGLETCAKWEAKGKGDAKGKGEAKGKDSQTNPGSVVKGEPTGPSLKTMASQSMPSSLEYFIQNTKLTNQGWPSPGYDKIMSEETFKSEIDRILTDFSLNKWKMKQVPRYHGKGQRALDEVAWLYQDCHHTFERFTEERSQQGRFGKEKNKKVSVFKSVPNQLLTRLKEKQGRVWRLHCLKKHVDGTTFWKNARV